MWISCYTAQVRFICGWKKIKKSKSKCRETKLQRVKKKVKSIENKRMN